ncbi:ABC transporter substrate-binding protein [Burkholderia ambifaria]|uniref:ABC transporter substrate-binding protein n=1 Tax=Burkholderia ambifaria TaxID=152480 RepID=UPI001B9ECC24|nr:ABC transporter substrate-binding protein [Burkholderia ambifaria]MBR8257585.1 ABC transporter substrate-binding protein [Burkholderia ambifaria]
MKDIGNFFSSASRQAAVAAAVCVFGAAMMHSGSVEAQTANANPVKIGLVYAKQGPSAAIGEFLEQGTEIAVQQAGGKVLGRPVELIWLDEPNPQVGQQNMQKLIDEHHVVAVMGGTISSTALAMAAVAQRRQVPFVATNGAAAELTGTACNRYTFRTQPTALVHTRALLPYLAKTGKNWYSITPSYAFGQDTLKEARALSPRFGATLIGSDEVAVNTADYSAYLLKIRQAKPDAVITALVGGDLSNFLKQWNELGLKDKTPIAGVAVSDSDFWSIGPGATTGIYAKPWYYADPRNTPEDKAFIAAFESRYHHPPSEKAWLGWFSTRALLQAIDAAKSTDPKAIVSALEKWHVNENGIDVKFREGDHQLVRPLLILRAKQKITDKYDFFDVVEHTPATPADLAAAYGTPGDLGCRMPSL